MTIEHLLYTPQQEGGTNTHPSTMVMLVDGDMFDRCQRGEDVGSNATVMDSYDVFKYSNGNQGTLIRPSKTEISEIFGTTDSDAIADFMIKNGHTKTHGRRKNSSGGQSSNNDDNQNSEDPHSRMHVARSGRPL